MGIAATVPQLSVVIPTFNRAELLNQSLRSLADQDLAQAQYEVVIVDDGSTDATPKVCRDHSSTLPLRYYRLTRSGTSAAKNLGIFTAQAPLLLLFDDDDLAAPNLLREHLESHRRHPEENVAVLGHTTWAPGLPVTELMNHVLNVSHQLFRYSHLKDGQELDYTYFWAGRISCKQVFLAKRGIFNPQLQAAAHEDVELGYRLSRFGLKVIYNPRAVQYMNRPITFREFCLRCERQGRAQWMISRLHSEAVVRQHWKHWPVIDAEKAWREEGAALSRKVQRVEEIEARLPIANTPTERQELLKELRRLYNWTFRFFQIKGVIEAMQAAAGPRPSGPQPLSPVPGQENQVAVPDSAAAGR